VTAGGTNTPRYHRLTRCLPNLHTLHQGDRTPDLRMRIRRRQKRKYLPFRKLQPPKQGLRFLLIRCQRLTVMYYEFCPQSGHKFLVYFSLAKLRRPLRCGLFLEVHRSRMRARMSKLYYNLSLSGVEFYFSLLLSVAQFYFISLERWMRRYQTSVKSFDEILINVPTPYCLTVDLSPSKIESLREEVFSVTQGIQSRVSQQFQAICTFLRRITRGPLHQGPRSASSSSPFGNQLHFLFVTLHLTNFGRCAEFDLTN
jgi:hypothetical protein